MLHSSSTLLRACCGTPACSADARASRQDTLFDPLSGASTTTSERILTSKLSPLERARIRTLGACALINEEEIHASSLSSYTNIDSSFDANLAIGPDGGILRIRYTDIIDVATDELRAVGITSGPRSYRCSDGSILHATLITSDGVGGSVTSPVSCRLALHAARSAWHHQPAAKQGRMRRLHASGSNVSTDVCTSPSSSLSLTSQAPLATTTNANADAPTASVQPEPRSGRDTASCSDATRLQPTTRMLALRSVRMEVRTARSTGAVDEPSTAKAEQLGELCASVSASSPFPVYRRERMGFVADAEAGGPCGHRDWTRVVTEVPLAPLGSDDCAGTTGGSASTDAHMTSSGSDRLRVTVERCYVGNLVSDGHMLVALIPFITTQGHSSTTADATQPVGRVNVALVPQPLHSHDGSATATYATTSSNVDSSSQAAATSGGAGWLHAAGGIGRVVCFSNDLIRRSSHASSHGDATGSCAGGYACTLDVLPLPSPSPSPSSHGSGPAVGGAGAMPSPTGTGTGEVLIMIEAGNVTYLWPQLQLAPGGDAASLSSSPCTSLLSPSSGNHLPVRLLPAGLRRLAECGPGSAVPALPSRTPMPALTTAAQPATSSGTTASLADPLPLAAPVHAPAPIVHVDPAHLPRHIAIVMDGNGRWAKQRGLPRTEGHVAGVEAIHRIIRACRRLGIGYLTLYAFSAQNWSRPAEEVKALMALLVDFVHTDCQELIDNGMRLLVNGDVQRLPAPARSGLLRLIDASKGNTGLTLCLALSYGGREEIVTGAAAACRAALSGRMDPDSLTVDSFRSFMPHPDVPDPDLLIRTSGELRISNFLLWQIAYTELYVTPLLWPDFGDRELMEALGAYAGRERRFGKTGDQVKAEVRGQGQEKVAGGAASSGLDVSSSASSAGVKNASTLVSPSPRHQAKGSTSSSSPTHEKRARRGQPLSAGSTSTTSSSDTDTDGPSTSSGDEVMVALKPSEARLARLRSHGHTRSSGIGRAGLKDRVWWTLATAWFSCRGTFSGSWSRPSSPSSAGSGGKGSGGHTLIASSASAGAAAGKEGTDNGSGITSVHIVTPYPLWVLTSLCLAPLLLVALFAFVAVTPLLAANGLYYGPGPLVQDTAGARHGYKPLAAAGGAGDAAPYWLSGGSTSANHNGRLIDGHVQDTRLTGHGLQTATSHIRPTCVPDVVAPVTSFLPLSWWRYPTAATLTPTGTHAPVVCSSSSDEASTTTSGGTVEHGFEAAAAAGAGGVFSGEPQAQVVVPDSGGQQGHGAQASSRHPSRRA